MQTKKLNYPLQHISSLDMRLWLVIVQSASTIQLHSQSNLLETFICLFLSYFHLYSMDLDVRYIVCLVSRVFVSIIDVVIVSNNFMCRRGGSLSIWAWAWVPVVISVCWPGCHWGSKWAMWSPAKRSICCPQHHGRASLGTKPELKQSAWLSRPTCVHAPAAGSLSSL